MMSKANQKKVKQVLMIGGVSLAAWFVLASLAKRVPAVASVQQTIAQGL